MSRAFVIPIRLIGGVRSLGLALRGANLNVLKERPRSAHKKKSSFCVDLRQLLLIGRNESHLRWSSELPGQREGRGTILQGIRPHQRHQSEKWLWFCGKLKDFSPVTMRKLDSMRFYVAFNN